MAALSAFMPYVLPDVPMCPDFLAEQKALIACIEFCERTDYWRYEHPALSLVKNIKDLEVRIPDGSQLVTIIDPINFNGEKAYSTTKEWLDMYESDWETKTGNKVRTYYSKSLGKFRPVPYPDTTATASVTFDVSLKPLPSATTVEDFLFDEFFQVIADGALSKLYAMSEKKWTNERLAMFHKEKFDEALVAASRKAKSGFKTHERYRRSKGHYF